MLFSLQKKTNILITFFFYYGAVVEKDHFTTHLSRCANTTLRLSQGIYIIWTEIISQGLVEGFWYQKVHHPSPANFPVVSLSNYAWKSFFPIQKEFLCIFWNSWFFFLRHSRNKFVRDFARNYCENEHFRFFQPCFPFSHDSRTLFIFFTLISTSVLRLSHTIYGRMKPTKRRSNHGL
jgi:hypothetical protein